MFTKDFLDDIAANTTDEAFLFSATTQTYFDNVNGNGDSRPGSRNTANDTGNSRGLGNVDRTRNYFRTTIETDAYNTERFSLVSGANAVQFGLGGAAGTAEGWLQGASLSANFRYRGASLIGFPTKLDTKGRVRTDRDNPYMSDAYVITGLMANYRFRAGNGTAARLQLNVNNVFNTQRLFVTRAFADGRPRNYGRQAGREFILSLELER